MSMKFRKKPVVIEAIQYNGRNMIEITKFIGTAREVSEDFMTEQIAIRTLEGIMKVDVGDWVIKGVKGEFYPVKDDIFRATYEKVN